MEASALRRQRAAVLPRSRRILGTFSDDRLIEQVRRGNVTAFEVIYDRHYRGILSFCRHMLGSREEAEDAVQQTFASAYTDLQSNDREIRLKAWLYTIARNRCLSVLRARREQAADLAEEDLPTAGLSEQVQQRADLQELLADLRELPDDQREALVLFEIGDLSQTEVANVIGVEPVKVKALVFQARSALIENREARAIPCSEIREQLATATGGALRRGPLRRHVKSCEGCREYRDQVKTQRRALAALLPVVPTAGLKQSVLGAIGFGGGAGGGGIAAGGGVATGAAGVGASGAGGGAGFLASFGGMGAAKLVVAATIGTGALVGGGIAVEHTVTGGDNTPAAEAAEENGAGGGAGQSGTAGNPGVGNPGLGSSGLVGNAGDDPAGTKDDKRRDDEKKNGRDDDKSGESKSGGRGRGSGHSGGKGSGRSNGNAGGSSGSHRGGSASNAGGRSGARTGGRGNASSNAGSGGNRGSAGSTHSNAGGNSGGSSGTGGKSGSAPSHTGTTQEPPLPVPPPTAGSGTRSTQPVVPRPPLPDAVDATPKLPQ